MTTDEDERQYHLELAPGEVPETVLLPGDPDRLETIVETWDDHEVVAEHREYRTATGTVEGTPIGVTSTGIGSPSAGIAVEELAEVGAETLVRVGSCGTVQPDIAVGDLVIVTGAVRGEGTSDAYVPESYPAVADPEVVTALVTAAERLGYPYHTGLAASTDSFYVGQGRPGHGGFLPADAAGTLEELREANVAILEMETSAILTLSSVYDLRAGAVCTVFADRTAGEFRTEGEGRAAAVASLATAILATMDDRTAAANAGCFHAGLEL